MATPAPIIEGFGDLVEVGRGGFATVYRAKRLRDGATVAVKVLHTWALDDVNRRRFAAERGALRALAGEPAVVQLLGYGECSDGRPYLVMEYMEAGSLADRLAAGAPMPWPEALGMGRSLADALGAAHGAGLIHRDVKPENVLMGQHGQWLVADFGLSRFADAHRSRTGQIVASISHAAPEMFTEARPTAAIDVYGLASTLFTALSGRTPFGPYDDEVPMAIVHRIAEHRPPDLREHGIPDPVAGAVEQALSKDPAARPAGARAFGTVLAEAASEAERYDPNATRKVEWLPPSPQARPAPAASRRRRAPWAAALAGVAGAAAAAVLYFGPLVDDQPPSEPAVAVVEVSTEAEGSADQAPPPPPGPQQGRNDGSDGGSPRDGDGRGGG